jgi:hypothetical protein
MGWQLFRLVYQDHKATDCWLGLAFRLLLGCHLPNKTARDVRPNAISSAGTDDEVKNDSLRAFSI